MNLHRMLVQRQAEGRPLRIGLIGAGKFGTMYLSQALRTPGVHLVGVADLQPARAKAALRRVGWPAERLAARSFADAVRRGATRIVDDAAALIAAPEVDVIIDDSYAFGSSNLPDVAAFLAAYKLTPGAAADIPALANGRVRGGQTWQKAAAKRKGTVGRWPCVAALFAHQLD